VTAEDFFIQNSSNRKTVEAISESLPQLDIIPPFTLIIEPIDAIYTCTFVIASQQKEILWIFYLVRQKKANRLQ
jgi:hypothetical protein